MNIKYLVCHHTASNRGAGKSQLNGVNNFHKNKNWNTNPNGAVVKCKLSSLGWYVQYHYFIDVDGTETQTAKEDEIRWHAGNVNDVALGVCLAGHFDQELPLPEQVESLRKRLVDLKKRYPNAEIVPHRKFASYKSCYGKLLKDDWANNLIKNTMRYVRVENEQYLLYEEPFKIAFNIADIDELIHLEAKGFRQEIEIITPEELLQYEIYPLVSKSKAEKIINMLKDYYGMK